ncbi:MAG: hypothetical protein PVF43_12750, partial [Candidatus Eiseniibacteriota bacterium]
MSGLSRFDGVEFQHHDMVSEPLLEDAMITRLLVDRNDALWIGTAQGKLYLHENGRFRPRPCPSPGHVTALLDGRDGALWAGGTRGVLRLAGDGATWIVGPGVSVTSLIETDEAIWAASRDAVLRITPGDDGATYRIERRVTEPRSWEMGTLLADPRGLLLFGNATIDRLRSATVDHIRLATMLDATLWDSIRTAQETWEIYDAYRDAHDTVWLSTATGLFRVAADGLAPGALPVNPPRRVLPYTLTGRVNRVIRDADGALWVATEVR